jgi:hypothetical protein
MPHLKAGPSHLKPGSVLVRHRALLDLRRMKLGYGEGGAGTEVGSSMVPRARVLV